MVDHLPIMCEALNAIPSTAKIDKQKLNKIKIVYIRMYRADIKIDNPSKREKVILPIIVTSLNHFRKKNMKKQSCIIPQIT